MTTLSPQCAALTVEGHEQCLGVMLEAEGPCECACHLEWVWQCRLDGRYACRVLRTADYTGHLLMTDMTTGEVVVDEEVGLAYGARFGPDMDDVARWENECLVAADRHSA